MLFLQPRVECRPRPRFLRAISRVSMKGLSPSHTARRLLWLRDSLQFIPLEARLIILLQGHLVSRDVNSKQPSSEVHLFSSLTSWAVVPSHQQFSSPLSLFLLPPKNNGSWKWNFVNLMGPLLDPHQPPPLCQLCLNKDVASLPQLIPSFFFFFSFVLFLYLLGGTWAPKLISFLYLLHLVLHWCYFQPW